MSAVTPATDVAPAHMVEVFEAKVLHSDYPLRSAGSLVTIGRCSCGWSVVRQLRRAVEEQVAKHRKAVAA